jgi:hypothetical protein
MAVTRECVRHTRRIVANLYRTRPGRRATPEFNCCNQVRMTGISFTTKHEKRLYANHLFAVSYGSFLGRPFHSLRGF